MYTSHAPRARSCAESIAKQASGETALAKESGAESGQEFGPGSA